MSHYTHLTPTERGSLYAFHEEGLSIRAIADKLKRSPATISRELRRGRRNRHRYQPEVAQRIYERKRRKCRRKRILSAPVLLELIRYLIEEEHWSPEQIVERARLHGKPLPVSAKTIYRLCPTPAPKRKEAPQRRKEAQNGANRKRTPHQRPSRGGFQQDRDRPFGGRYGCRETWHRSHRNAGRPKKPYALRSKSRTGDGRGCS